MHQIPIEDQTFDFSITTVMADVFCNRISISTIERFVGDDGARRWRFWYDGQQHNGFGSFEQALTALKRKHAEAAMKLAAVEAIGRYVAEQSAKLFGEEA